MTTADGPALTDTKAASADQNWQLLRLFNFYRLTIAGGALLIGLLAADMALLGADSPALFQGSALLYLTVAIVAVQTIFRRRPDFETQALLLTYLDIIFLTLLLHASGGIASGLGLLLLVAVAASSLMLARRVTLFFAAAAAIAVLVEHSWDLLRNLASGAGAITLTSVEGYPQVGLLGVGLFVTAYLGHTLATRLRATEALAHRRGVDIVNLSHMNEIIIDRMQTGVIACARNGGVKFMNRAALRFFDRPEGVARNTPLSEVAPDLAIQLHQWTEPTRTQPPRKLLTTPSGYTVLPRFVALSEDRKAGALIFVEDMGILRQQAQQLKIAALARLTASIAHEIRNPLGALSNAAQLLAETNPQDAEERRLVTIIEEQSKRMNTIVQNVTQLSRRDRINPTRLALGNWLAEFVHQYCETTSTPSDAFAIHGIDGFNVCVDPDQLHQVIYNLVQNALRHSPPFTGTPLVKFQGQAEDEHGPAALDVIDWGRGITPDAAEHIFDPFFTTTPKGTGLGLYIARELCEGNGGTLTYHPGDGGVGSRFRVTFSRLEECAELGSV